MVARGRTVSDALRLLDAPLSKHRQPEADQGETEDQQGAGQGFGGR